MAAFNHFGAFPLAGFNGVVDDDGQALSGQFPYRERPEYWIDPFEGEREYLGEVPDNILEDVYLKLTFKEAVQLYWTVKKWNISFSFGGYLDRFETDTTISVVSIDPFNFSVDHVFAQKQSYPYIYSQDPPPIENEKDLITPEILGSFLLPSSSSYECNVFVTDKLTRKSDGAVVGVDSSGVKTIGTLTINNDFFASGFSMAFFRGQVEDNFYYFNACRNDEFVFYPWRIVFESNLDFLYNSLAVPPYNDFYGAFSTVGSISYLDGAIPTGNKVTLFLPSGRKIEKRLYDATQNYQQDPFGQTSFFCPPFNNDIVIRPSEYFEYDPEDGIGPIYDKNPTEGSFSLAKLRDPITLKKL